MSTIHPLGENVLIKKKNQQEKTASGFIIPEGANKPALYGEVIGVGGRCDEEIQVGQKVLYAKYGGTEVGEFILMHQNEILGYIEDEKNMPTMQ